MVQKVQIKRTEGANQPPLNLSPGELVIEMNEPCRLWVGVPATLHPDMRKLLYDSSKIFISQAEADVRYVNVVGDTMTGPLNVTVKGSNFGTPSGAPFNSAVNQADANFTFYNYDGGTGTGNWAGMGTDSGGNWWLRTGVGGSPTPALRVDVGQNVFLHHNPTQPLHAATKEYVDAAVGGIPLPPDTSLFVRRAGDTMSGDLALAYAQPSLILNKVNDGYALIYGQRNGVTHWRIDMGDGAVLTGGDAGNNFNLHRFGDGGNHLGSAFSIRRSDGLVSIGRDLSVGGAVGISGTLNAYGYVHMSSGFTAYAASQVSGAFGVTGRSTFNGFDNVSGGVWFGGTEQVTVSPTLDTMYINNHGDIDSSGQVRAASAKFPSYLESGFHTITWYGGGGHIRLVGSAGGPTNYYQAMDWNANAAPAAMFLHHAVGTHVEYKFEMNGACHFDFRNNGEAYKLAGGVWGSNSDARVKNVHGDYTAGLAEILQIHPVRYSYKGNDSQLPPSNFNFGAKLTPEQEKEVPRAPYRNSPAYKAAKDVQEFIGLIAQEAEIPMPEMVSLGAMFIDGARVEDFRQLNTTPLIFALVNAVKTLAARVEALEATR